MNIQVVYHSKTGNTKKVADAIANELNVTATPVDQAQGLLSQQIDLLFIGDGMYFGGMDKSTKDFIAQLDAAKVKHAAVFSTSGGSWPMGPSGLDGRLQKQGISVSEKSFKCHGGAFGVVFSSHPNDKDLSDARNFAKSVANTIK